MTHPLSDAAKRYLAAINAPGISTIAVQWTSTVAPAAKHKGTALTKETTAIVMVGAEYADLAVNNDREVGDLPWGEWSVRPFIVTHRGADYVRMYCMDRSVRTTYKVNGEVVDRDAFNGFLTPSAAKAKRPNGGCITVKAENVTVLS